MSETAVSATGRRFFLCDASEVAPGERVIRDVGGRSIGVFNVDGRFFALHNRCPHRGGALCLGPVTGTALPTDDYRYEYGREGEIVRCAWHGWEFEIASGRCLVDPRMRARSFPVEVEDGGVYVLM
ncbi:MAG: Rieske (2Fe-2S) protein [Actinobacteria bacterium]|nr:Rieske (2Fe-2S) protein [Actinomycetota bacterium]